jgi:hypothetical protein
VAGRPLADWPAGAEASSTPPRRADPARLIARLR